jgi:hypothetical protein
MGDFDFCICTTAEMIAVQVQGFSFDIGEEYCFYPKPHRVQLERPVCSASETEITVPPTVIKLARRLQCFRDTPI